MLVKPIVSILVKRIIKVVREQSERQVQRKSVLYLGQKRLYLRQIQLYQGEIQLYLGHKHKCVRKYSYVLGKYNCMWANRVLVGQHTAACGANIFIFGAIMLYLVKYSCNEASFVIFLASILTVGRNTVISWENTVDMPSVLLCETCHVSSFPGYILCPPL